jgi:Leucine-rich repeat (LRR) protein
LSLLNLSGTAIEKIPSSIERLVGLFSLYLDDCKSLMCTPSAIICKLKSLKIFHVTGCSKLEKLIENEGEMEYCLEELKYLSISGAAIRKLTCLSRMKNLQSLCFSGSRVIRKHDVGFGHLLGRKSPEPLRLVLPSLRALCSLVTLDLSDQNLCEGDILDDICCLSFLGYLDLSGNNFVALPASIQCLF